MGRQNLFQVFDFRPGDVPLLVSIPHAGEWIPNHLSARMTEIGRRRPDTDWFVDRLYDVPIMRHVSCLAARVSRYVVDLNRPPNDQSLYPGQQTTGLCPVTTFHGDAIYQPGQEPTEVEISDRVATYWVPYHLKLRDELERLQSQFGRVILLDAHSIASRVPRLFDGVLPDWNFGTNRGQSCGSRLQSRVECYAAELKGYSWEVNGRFVGGCITRHYGTSAGPVEAVQLEL
ncbi:MAG TPA: N-formylglutamate deformylase, partial [Pirellulaceae bacterium]|nr:N-formylglutamate deformylase [Pirellulaceae bacterium]